MKFMEFAIEEAKKALSFNEVPVGAIIVKDDKIIGKGYNLVENKKSSIYHAEIIAIKMAQKNLRDWRLNGCVMYVTIEPCLMCTGAILNSRIDKVIFGLKEEKFGAIISRIKIENCKFNHKIQYEIATDYKDEIKNMMRNFFKIKRMKAEKTRITSNELLITINNN